MQVNLLIGLSCETAKLFLRNCFCTRYINIRVAVCVLLLFSLFNSYSETGRLVFDNESLQHHFTPFFESFSFAKLIFEICV